MSIVQYTSGYSIYEDNEKDVLRRINESIWSFFCENAEKYGFESREGQQDMALDIGQAIADKHHLIVEAGVGIGKSFAYIVPLMYFRKNFRRPVIISTSTIALQEQLRGDIETISRVLHHPVQVIIAKGQSHYICRKRVDELEEEELRSAVLKCIEEKAIERKDLGELIQDDSMWNRIAVNSFGRSYCRNCAYERDCIYGILRKKMARSDNDFIVCNHDLLTAHLRKGQYAPNPILPWTTPIVVIDEAHNLEDKVRNQMTAKISYADMQNAINTARGAVILWDDGMERQARIVLDSLEKLINVQSQYAKQQIAKDPRIGDNGRYGFLKNKEVIASLAKIQQQLTNLDSSIQARVKDRLVQAQENAVDKIYETARMFQNLEEEEDNVIWIEGDIKNPRRVRLAMCPNDISPIIRQLFFNQLHINILTSATLTSRGDGEPEEQYEYLTKSIGFPVGEDCKIPGDLAETKTSPFDYDNHAMIYLADDLPHPTKQKEEFVKKACDRIVELLRISGGSALILFTAKCDLNDVYTELESRKLPYKLIKPKLGSSQQDTLETFRKEGNSVLLGTGAFWEGINLVGDVLTNVIIFKLPFPVPDPIIVAKQKMATDGLMDVLVPEMVVKLKQGIGRLIRSETDRGIVSILDPRLSDAYNSRYRDVVFQALPIKNKTSSMTELESFYSSVLGSK